jgi:osmoprotectant transport system permease protein
MSEAVAVGLVSAEPEGPPGGIGIGKLVGVPLLLLAAWAGTAVVLLSRPLDERESVAINLQEFQVDLSAHLYIVLTALGIALVIALPLGVVLARSFAVLRAIAFGVANLSQAIPSVALLGLAYTIIGSGPRPAILALTAFSVLPILRNTVVGLTSIDHAIIEAAVGMGMSRTQSLFRVELPLALPTIFAGVRTGIVLNISSATLATFIGGGGLGDLLDKGIESNLPRVTLVGAVMVASLAMLADWIAGLVEARLTARV